MERGGNPNEAMPALRTDRRRDRIARRRQRCSRRGNVQHLVGAVALARIDDRKGASIGEAQLAAVAGLAAALRVEDGAIEADATLVDGDDARLAGAQIGVVAGQQGGRWSSHSGMGSLRSRKKAGLKSFDW